MKEELSLTNTDVTRTALGEILQYWHCPSQFENSSDHTNPKIDKTGNRIRDFQLTAFLTTFQKVAKIIAVRLHYQISINIQEGQTDFINQVFKAMFKE